MSVFLQFNYPQDYLQNEPAKKAMENYVGFLERAFEQYWNLWTDYIKLQEKHEHCNINFSSQIEDNEPCAEIKNQLTPQKQLNSNIIADKKDCVSLLELDTLHIDSIDFESDVEFEPENVSKSLCEDINDDLPQSPVFSRTRLKTYNTFAKKILQSPEATCDKSNMKEHQSIEKVPSKCSQKLGISTSYHVETTFLPNGKRLKQSRLVFKDDKKKVPTNIDDTKKVSTNVDDKKKISTNIDNKKKVSANIDKLKLTGTIQKEEPSFTDSTFKKEIFVVEENIIEADEIPDVIEVSPTQKNVKSKVRHRLKLKRKILQKAESSPNKNKYNSPERGNVEREIIDDIDFALYSSPKYTSTQVEDINFSPKDSTVNTLKDKKIDINSFSPTKKYNKPNVEQFLKPINQKKDQPMKDTAQSIVQNVNNFDKDETFYLPGEEAVNKNDFMDDFSLIDTENKPPMKEILLAKLNSSRKKKVVVTEQLNMRCKADRAKLNGWDCWECEEYYKNLPLSEKELQKRKNQCSRHRYRYEKPSTPEGFWDPDFPETLSCTFQQNTK